MHQKKRGNMPNRCHSDLKLKLHTTTEKHHFAHHLGQNSSQLGGHVTTQKYHCHTFYSQNWTNHNASYSIPIRVYSALFKDSASKLSGEMRRDKRASHRYRIYKPCIGGTQLQELHCEQTVWLSSALLCWEMQMSSLPNEGSAQLWVAWCSF